MHQPTEAVKVIIESSFMAIFGFRPSHSWASKSQKAGALQHDRIQTMK